MGWLIVFIAAAFWAGVIIKELFEDDEPEEEWYQFSDIKDYEEYCKNMKYENK